MRQGNYKGIKITLYGEGRSMTIKQHWSKALVQDEVQISYER